MPHCRTLVACAAFGIAPPALAQTREPRAPERPTNVPVAGDAQRAPTDSRPTPDAASQRSERRALFSFKRYAPDEEPWDPSWRMDPRIGRHQRWNAPN